MGTKDRVFEYREERDNDLIDAYHRQVDEVSYPFCLMDVLERAVETPSKRFWVSPGRALCVMSELERGATLEGMTRNKRRMYQEIHRRVRRLQAQPKYRETALSDLVHMVIEEQAPSFYMTPQSAKVILHQIRVRKRCRRNREP